MRERLFGPKRNFSGPPQNGGHQSKKPERLRKECHLPSCPIVTAAGKGAEERPNEGSQENRVEGIFCEGFYTVQPRYAVERNAKTPSRSENFDGIRQNEPDNG